jgi:phosphoribosylamine--glycine ligase
VLAVTGTGADLRAARDAAYDVAAGVQLPGAQWRTDIAARAVRGEISV